MRPVLDARKRAEVLALLSFGESLRQAAAYVACAPTTITNAARRDPEFAHKMASARQAAALHASPTARRRAGRSARGAIRALELHWAEMAAERRAGSIATDAAVLTDDGIDNHGDLEIAPHAADDWDDLSPVPDDPASDSARDPATCTQPHVPSDPTSPAPPALQRIVADRLARSPSESTPASCPPATASPASVNHPTTRGESTQLSPIVLLLIGLLLGKFLSTPQHLDSYPPHLDTYPEHLDDSTIHWTVPPIHPTIHPASALRTPHSALRTPHSAFPLRTPNSELRTPHSPLPPHAPPLHPSGHSR
jgi:hypothetical protein